METNKYAFMNKNKDKLSLMTVSKIVTAYNRILYRYTKGFAGKLACPKTDLSAIPKKFITVTEYLNSKAQWKQIMKFVETANISDINDYLETMIKNWSQIAVSINMADRKVPLSSIIFSVKMSSMYDRFKTKEATSDQINKHLALKKTEDFHRLTPSLQSNINSLFRLKNLNSELTYSQIVQIFSGEFEPEFATTILSMDEAEITHDTLTSKFK